MCKSSHGVLLLGKRERAKRGYIPLPFFSQTGEGGGTHLLLALVITIATHPFRDGTPFLLQMRDLKHLGAHYVFFRMLHRNSLFLLSPPCFAGRGSRENTSAGGCPRVLQAASNSIMTRWQDAHSPCSCLLYTSPSPRDKRQSRMPSSA